MKIGDLDLGQNPLLLAPMEDVTDPSFRVLCKRYGADLMYTEFVSADALIRHVERTKNKMTILPEERPVGIQIYGKETDTMVEAAKIAEEANPELIDINFGCPVKKIAKKGAGAGMLQDIPKMLEITSAVVKAVNLPVTVKTRLGWDDNNKIITNIAEPLQDTGIAALTIHGRTRAQMYTGEADWSLIGEVKNNPRIHIPIIGNGDLTNPVKARDYLNRYGVDALMIGRPSIGRPWIFKEIKHYLQTGELLPPPSIPEHVAMLKEQLDHAVNWFDERRGILHMRRHMAVSFKGLPNFRPLKIKMLRTDGYEELIQVLDVIADTYKEYHSLYEE
ncbi:tRNA dihydrouridine synthase DusB [Marinilabiliaceae bacterium JC017]|nr:tRNA dihydrouridine synthase DusB [Marinilabiliaceae bacterium JC017]